ncbi:MAG: toll/interleukin-1 receptor domain-containing protein [Clostridia bacterium]|nr:toll/interleukin-1 receptor domain-containing protein [Clostridia bacterium]
MKRDVFISYHTASAKPVVEKISQALEADGISCWYAPRDCELQWAEAIVKAIDSATVFLVVLNAAAIDSENVKNEMNIAHENFCKHKICILPFQIEGQCLQSDFTRYYLGRIHVYDGTVAPMDDRIKELVNRVSYVCSHGLEDEEARFDEKYGGGFVSAEITPVVGFVGRRKEMQELDEALQIYRKVFVSGMGGMGKSEMVRQYLSLNRQNYRAVMWGTHKSSLMELLAEDGFVNVRGMHRDPPEESDESYARRKLEYLAQHGTREDLLVIDNFDREGDDWLERVMQLPVSILFTTRYAPDESQYCFLHLHAMDNMEDLLSLFNKGYQKALNDEERGIVEQIIERLGRHTLAIKLVAGYMRRNREKPAKMLDKLQDSLHFVQKDVGDAISSIFAISHLTEEEQKVLLNLTLVPRDGIEAEEFADLAELEDYEAINRLVAESWILHDSARDYIALHPMVAKTASDKIGYSDDLCETYISNLSHRARDAKFIPAARRSDTLKQVEWLLQNLPEDSRFFEEAYIAGGKLLHAFSMHTKIVSYLPKLVNGNYSLYARAEAAIDIADAYRCLHDNENLREKADEADGICRQLDDEDPVGYHLKMQLEGRFGWYYYNTEQYPQALEHFTRARDYFTHRYQEEHAAHWEVIDDERVGWSFYNVAIVLIEMGRYDEAVQELAQAQCYFEKIGMVFAIAAVRRCLGTMYLKKGEYAAAEDCVNEALAQYLSLVGEQHDDVAYTRHQLAKVYLAQGREAEAREQEAMAYAYCTAIERTRIVPDWLFGYQG